MITCFLCYRKESNGKNYVKYEVIGSNHVAVPTHFFKVLAIERTNGELELEAYVMPNEVIDNSVPLTSFQVLFKITLLLISFLKNVINLCFRFLWKV